LIEAGRINSWDLLIVDNSFLSTALSIKVSGAITKVTSCLPTYPILSNDSPTTVDRIKMNIIFIEREKRTSTDAKKEELHTQESWCS
jgi:hypothetical protein